jgi:radical SAM protein with 4Fe4S-binding SPASM domain
MCKEDCLRIVEEAAELGVDKLAFSGGEPLNWPSIGESVRIASELGLDVTIYTSGNVDKISEILATVRTNGARRCVFSIFGATSDVHERITRTKNSFEGTIRAIEAAVQAGLTAEVHFVPLSDNYRELEAIDELTSALGVGKISVLRFVPHGRGALFKRHALGRLQNAELRRAILRLRHKGKNIRTGSPYNFLMLNDQPACHAAIDRLIVGPDMKIYPCDAFKQIEAKELVGDGKLSHLNGYHLEECWNGSPFLEAIRRYLTTPFADKCEKCNALDMCASGCLAQKVIKYGALKKKPDPMCLMT